MTKNDILNLPIPAISKLIEDKKLSVMELLKMVTRNIDLYENDIKSYLWLNNDPVTSQFSNSKLFGIPISVKDTFAVKNTPTTAGSKILENFISPYDATAYLRLKNAGTVLIGKTNMDEFAHGFTTEHSAFQITKNPWDLSKIPGGSSGGSAASVAARECLLSLASENFGSIIQPAAFCGIVGMKPTYGRSSRYGIIAMASSLECPGIMGKCIEDIAIGIEAISGFDPLDATSLRSPIGKFYNDLSTEVSGNKIAIIKPPLEFIDKEIVSALENSIKIFGKIGVSVDFIDWYGLDSDAEIYDVLYRAEVSSNLARYDGICYGYRSLKPVKHLHDYYLATRNKFGDDVKRQILTDPVSLSESGNIYFNALKLRRKNRDYIDSVLEKYAAIVTPTSTFVDLPIGSATKSIWKKSHRQDGQVVAATLCPSVLYGYPAITFPIGFSKSNMPIGINMFSSRLEEQKILNLAYAFQEESGLKCLIPKLIENYANNSHHRS